MKHLVTQTLTVLYCFIIFAQALPQQSPFIQTQSHSTRFFVKKSLASSNLYTNEISEVVREEVVDYAFTIRFEEGETTFQMEARKDENFDLSDLHFSWGNNVGHTEVLKTSTDSSVTYSVTVNNAADGTYDSGDELDVTVSFKINTDAEGTIYPKFSFRVAGDADSEVVLSDKFKILIGNPHVEHPKLITTALYKDNFTLEINFKATSLGYAPFLDIIWNDNFEILGNVTLKVGGETLDPKITTITPGNCANHPTDAKDTAKVCEIHGRTTKLLSFVSSYTILDASHCNDVFILEVAGKNSAKPLEEFDFYYRGGFALGNEYHTQTDAILSSSATDYEQWEKITVIPQVVIPKVSSSQPQLVLGPNFILNIESSLDIAEGLVLKHVELEIEVPEELSVYNFSTAAPVLQSPVMNGKAQLTASNTLRISLSDVTKATNSSVLIQCYAPEYNAHGEKSVPDPAETFPTKKQIVVRIINTVWTGEDGNPVQLHDNHEMTKTLDLCYIWMTLSHLIYDDQGYTGLTVKDELLYDWDFSISDYFSFEQARVDIVVGNGHVRPTKPVTLESRDGIEEKGLSLLSADWKGDHPVSVFIGHSNNVRWCRVRLPVRVAEYFTEPTRPIFHGDKLKVTAQLFVNDRRFNTPPQTETNPELARGKSKIITHAVNGEVCEPNCHVVFQPHLTVTYRITSEFPSSDLHKFSLRVFTPSPLVVSQGVTLEFVPESPSAFIPAVGKAKWGPASNFSVSEIPTIVQQDHQFIFNFNDLDTISSTFTKADILFTLEVDEFPEITDPNSVKLDHLANHLISLQECIREDCVCSCRPDTIYEPPRPEQPPPPPPPPPITLGDTGCETVFAYSGGTNIYGDDITSCFTMIDEDGNGLSDFDRWGWTNGPFSSGSSYQWDLYGAAGQCVLSKGTLVGKLLVDYAGDTAHVTYKMTPGSPFTIKETHLYVGPKILPSTKKSYTVAPGRFPGKHEGLGDATEDSFTMNVSTSGKKDSSDLEVGPDAYLVAHAVVCGFPR